MPRFHKLLLPALTLAVLTPARACGPDFPNAYLAEGSVSLLSAPEGYFAAEIAKLVPPKNSDQPNDPNIALIATANAAKRENELTETGVLRLELAKRGLTQERIDALAAELEAARAAIFGKDWAKPRLFSGDMPAEVALYLNGATAYWKNDWETAEKNWKKLLALPAAERRHYTVTAAYMLGRLCIPDANKGGLPERETPPPDDKHEMLDGIKWLRQARDAASAGFEDLSDLAVASLGWEARAHFFNDDDANAIHLYLEQHRDSAYASSAVLSLRAVARAALASAGDSNDNTRLRQLAQDEPSRRVITLYLLARFGVNAWSDSDVEKTLMRQSRAWAEILADAKLRDVPDTDRLAWLAYQAGYFDLAEKLLVTAPESSVPGNWIRAKLALRSGDKNTAELLLYKVTQSPDLIGAARPVACADLGRVRMSMGEYTGALDAFMAGGHWEDSAYIAERVLTLEELTQFVDRHCPEKTEAASKREFISASEERAAEEEQNIRTSLRHLLARRLARANKPDAAKKYFPCEFRQNYADYISDVRDAYDMERSAADRAKSFWRAAVSVRENGMEMLGTELEPDFFIWGGSFDWSEVAKTRQGALRFEGGPGAPTPEELERMGKIAIPQKRFHYRYRAADLGWWAASLMPNDSDETARMLITAGSWIKRRAPGEANKFYQALVIRCPSTDLGKAAAARGWFPEMKTESE